MIDRLLYKGVWYDLIDQRLLEESDFWGDTRRARPYVDLQGQELSPADYVAHWEIKNRRLYLCSATVIADNSDLLARLFPGQKRPIFAQWFTGGIDATGEEVTEEIKYPRGRELVAIRRCKLFVIGEGAVTQIRNSER